MPIPRILQGLGLDNLRGPSRFQRKYENFISLLERDRECHVLMADLQSLVGRSVSLEHEKICSVYEQLSLGLFGLLSAFKAICPAQAARVEVYLKRLDQYCKFILTIQEPKGGPPYCVIPGEDQDAVKELVGGKAKGIWHLKERVRAPIPQCFFVTVNGFIAFMEKNGILHKVRRELSGVDLLYPETVKNASRNIICLFEEASVPEEIMRCLIDYAETMESNRFSVRSSALFEDSHWTFAGQYKSLLHVTQDGLPSAYCDVIASKYTENAISYRIRAGLSDRETPMAVVVMEMVDAVLSGVAYSRDPEIGNGSDWARVTVVKGLGDALVGGEATGRSFRIRGTEVEYGHEMGTEAHKSLVTRLKELGPWIQRIEEYFHTPQDIEWCIDKQDRLFFLQTRPLDVVTQAKPDDKEREKTYALDAPIAQGGETVFPGCVCGKAFVLLNPADITRVPVGSIIVVPSALPEFSQVIGRVSGIVAERGAFTSHLATVAREFRVPALFGLEKACELIRSGDIVTLCAREKKVWRGKADEVCGEMDEGKGEDLGKDAPVIARLNALLSLVTPLNLSDPGSPDFRPEGCRSLHDILRYCHETAMREMFGLTEKGTGGAGVKRLLLPVPLSIYVLEVGDRTEGKEKKRRGKELEVRDIESPPFKAFLDGLLSKGITWDEVDHFDWAGFDQMALSGAVVTQKDSSLFSSFAIVGGDYINVNLKFGYHFTVLDCVCTDHAASNHLILRFAGGGGTEVGRVLRLRFIESMLSKWGLSVEVKGEELYARIKVVSQEELLRLLRRVGSLLGYTKLLDLRLTDETRLATAYSEFGDVIDGSI